MYNRQDAFYKKAKREGYRSRAAYKLIELNKKYEIYRNGHNVLDVGCAPGGWTQVVLQMSKTRVVGVDLLETGDMEMERFKFILGDITTQETVDEVLAACSGYDAVISDAAPNTSGSKLLDHVNSIELVRKIFYFACSVLKPHGNFICKVFEGEDRDALVKEMKVHFDFCKHIRPEATRKGSFEMYIILKGFKGLPKNEQ